MSISNVVCRVVLAGVASAGTCLAAEPSAGGGDGSLVGSWALGLPYETMNAGHLIVTRGADGALSGLLLMRWSSPVPCTRVTC